MSDQTNIGKFDIGLLGFIVGFGKGVVLLQDHKRDGGYECVFMNVSVNYT